MPIVWILAILFGGLVIYDASTKRPAAKRPAAKIPYPVGISTTDVPIAVDYALRNESSTRNLRSFARELAPYDKALSDRLFARASVIDESRGVAFDLADPIFASKYLRNSTIDAALIRR